MAENNAGREERPETGSEEETHVANFKVSRTRTAQRTGNFATKENRNDPYCQVPELPAQVVRVIADCSLLYRTCIFQTGL